MLYANYHTHTFRCGHCGANYKDEEYVQSALRSGLKVLGFSDHTPWPYAAGEPPYPNVRMRVEQISEYLEAVTELKKKYADRIHIYAGLECEYYPAYMPWLEEQKGKFDYLILGSHWAPSDEHGEISFEKSILPQQVRTYLHYTVQGMETGLFRYLAHPDVIFADYPFFDMTCREISYILCKRAKELRIPIEYNLNGIDRRIRGIGKGLGYPCEAFWEIAADTGCEVIIGCDAHRPEQLEAVELMENAQEYLQRLGLKCVTVLEGLE